MSWILRARDRDRDILARLRFGHRRQVNRGCPIPVAGVQAGAPGKSSQSVIVIVIVFILVFLVGHPRFTCRRCPNLNLAKISLSLSRLKSTHYVSPIRSKKLFLFYSLALIVVETMSKLSRYRAKRAAKRAQKSAQKAAKKRHLQQQAIRRRKCQQIANRAKIIKRRQAQIQAQQRMRLKKIAQQRQMAAKRRAAMKRRQQARRRK